MSHTNGYFFSLIQFSFYWYISNSYTIVCPSVCGDNQRGLASVLSHVHGKSMV